LRGEKGSPPPTPYPRLPNDTSASLLPFSIPTLFKHLLALRGNLPPPPCYDYFSIIILPPSKTLLSKRGGK